MSKKLIIITAAAGIVSFAGFFTFAWLTKTTPQGRSPGTPGLNQPAVAGKETELKLPPMQIGTTSAVGTGDSEMKKAMTEKQLKNLVYEVREKIQEYDNELQGLEAWERRLKMAQDTLKNDIENLNNLRIELASTVASLKEQRDKLLKSRVKIAETEKVNLISIAATYDKMDAASAGKILTNMCASGSTSQKQSGASSFDDAVKILHYMTERTKAKLLAELVTSEPKLAAVLCQRLKQILEAE